MKIREHEPEGFETLWTLWRDHARKTDGRGKARPTYRKWLLEGAEPQDMIDGARWHIRSLSERDKPYINLLSVYLNSERWVDECEMERAYLAKIAEAERIRDERRAAQPNVVQIEDHRPVITKPSEAERAQQVREARERLGLEARKAASE